MITKSLTLPKLTKILHNYDKKSNCSSDTDVDIKLR